MPEELLYKIGAAYIRVSDERQDEFSPTSQLKKIREYAEHEGYQVPDEYVFYDDGISGRSTKGRDDFNRMIAMAKEKSHPFDRIYVWKFSRFARNQEQAITYKSLLSKKNVTVVSVSEPIPDGPFGSLIERFLEWSDEYYSINLGMEVSRGMTEKATRGEPTCAPPFGYIMKDKKYYPDEEGGNADIVREIFQRYANGEGHRDIAILLGQKGIRTKMGNMPDNRWIEYVLHNPCYIGKIRWSLEGTRAVSKRDYENDKIMVVDGHHEPLISIELWNAVQKRSAEMKKYYVKHRRKSQPINYMTKGIVRCSACGGTLAMSSRTSGKKKTRTLQCCNYSRGSCHESHSVTLPKIENAIIEGLEMAFKTKQFVIVPKQQKKSDPSVIDYGKLIAVEERRLTRAREAYLAEIDTLEQYSINKKEITDRIAELTARRDNEILPVFDADEFAKKVIGVVEFIKREDVTNMAKNEALRTIIEKVVYEKAKGNVAIYFRSL